MALRQTQAASPCCLGPVRLRVRRTGSPGRYGPHRSTQARTARPSGFSPRASAEHELTAQRRSGFADSRCCHTSTHDRQSTDDDDESHLIRSPSQSCRKPMGFRTRPYPSTEGRRSISAIRDSSYHDAPNLTKLSRAANSRRGAVWKASIASALAGSIHNGCSTGR